MAASTRPALVGAFILGALGLGVAAILFFGSARLFAPTSRVVVYFSESVAGLDVGAPVTFHGARIGLVRRIAIRVSAARTGAARIPVVLELDTSRLTWEGGQGHPLDFERLVREGLRAQLALQSLITGQLRVDLDFHPDTPALLTGADVGMPEIPTVRSELDELRNELTGLHLRELFATAQNTLTSIGHLSNHVDTRLDGLIDGAERTFDSATDMFRTTREAVQQLRGEAATALRDIDGLAVDGRHQLDARSGDLARLFASADKVLTSANRVARQAELLVGSLNDMTEPRGQARESLEAALRDLAASASSLRGFSETIERNPNALLMGRAGHP